MNGNTQFSIDLTHKRRSLAYPTYKLNVNSSLDWTNKALKHDKDVVARLNDTESRLRRAINFLNQNSLLPNGSKVKRRKSKNGKTYYSKIVDAQGNDITPDCIKHLEHSLLKVNGRWGVMEKGSSLARQVDGWLPIQTSRGERDVRLWRDISGTLYTLKVTKTLQSVMHKSDNFKEEAQLINEIRDGDAAQATTRVAPLGNNLVDVHYMIDEFLGIDLFSRFTAKKTLEKWQWTEILLQCFHQIDALREKGYVHLDIKPENFVVKFDNKRNPKVTLIDLGFSCKFDATTQSVLACKGTPNYWPEKYRLDYYSGIFKEGLFNYFTDIFAWAKMVEQIYQANPEVKNSSLANLAGWIIAQSSRITHNSFIHNNDLKNQFQQNIAKHIQSIEIKHKTRLAEPSISTAGEEAASHEEKTANSETPESDVIACLREHLEEIIGNYEEYHERNNGCASFFSSRSGKEDRAHATQLKAAIEQAKSVDDIKNALKARSTASNHSHSLVRYIAKHEDFLLKYADTLELSLPTQQTNWHSKDAQTHAQLFLDGLAMLNVTEDLKPVKKDIRECIQQYCDYITKNNTFKDTGLNRAAKLKQAVIEAKDGAEILTAISTAMKNYHSWFGSKGIRENSLSSYLYQAVKKHKDILRGNSVMELSEDEVDNVHLETGLAKREAIRNLSAPAA